MALHTYKTRCKVTLQSYGETAPVDLTPFVRTLNVRKNLYETAGHFEIQLLPGKFDSMGQKTPWYYRIAPMDYIEIRFTRDHSLPEIPIVMRGFVNTVGLSMAVDGNGAPQRIYTVQGSDMGKIFEISRIYYLKEKTSDLVLIQLPGFVALKEKYGVQISGTPSKIISNLFDIAQAQLALIQRTQSYVPSMKYLASSTLEGESNQFALSVADGSIWDMMNFFDNSPWNELITLDLEDAFYLVFRETPWKYYPDGAYVQALDPTINSKTLGDPVSVPANNILSLNLTRSDAEVKNYFFTYPTQNMIGGMTNFKVAVLQGVETEADMKTNPYMANYDDEDSGAYRFGFRRFENTSEYFEHHDLIRSKQLAETLNLALVDAFRYNGAYETGDFTLKGNERLRPGVYMKFDYHTAVKAGFEPEYYVVGINHSLTFIVNQEQWTTTVNVQRGTGYLQKRDSGFASVDEEAFK